MSDCTKIPYASRNAATIAMRAIGRKKIARGLKGPIGAYFCGACKALALDLEVSHADTAVGEGPTRASTTGHWSAIAPQSGIEH